MGETGRVASRQSVEITVRVYPFLTAGRKTDTIFKFFCPTLYACHTVNDHLKSLKFSQGFVHGLTFLG